MTQTPKLEAQVCTLCGRAAAAKREDGTWGASQRRASPRHVQARYPSTARSGKVFSGSVTRLPH